MTRYFMRDTPLFQLEQQMMTPPNFKPKGHGLYRSCFRYKVEDVNCCYCINFNRKQCPLSECPYLEERIGAGALELDEFILDYFCSEIEPQLRHRLQVHLDQHAFGFFLSDIHQSRWKRIRDRCYRMSGRNKAALFLLTAYEDIWRRVIWHFDSDGFDFRSVRLSGIQPEMYSVYQAAKAIATDSRNITIADLASPELVTDEAFQLIICALLLAKYGDVILNSKRKTGDIKQ